jgi:hypothetical protein
MSKKVDDIPAPVLDFLASDNGSQFSQWIFQALDARSEVLLKPPPHFSGSSFEDPKVFIVNFDKAAKANRWNNVSRCLDILPSCFSGLAEEWFQDLMAENPRFASFRLNLTNLNTSFEERFLQRFLTSDLLREFRTRSAARRQLTSESGTAYYVDKLESIKMADPNRDWDEGTRMTMVIEGLEEERRKFVDLRNPKDLEELREAISRADSYSINNPMLRLEEQVRKLQDMLQSVLDKQSQPSRHVQFDVPRVPRVPRAVKSVTCYTCLQEGPNSESPFF